MLAVQVDEPVVLGPIVDALLGLDLRPQKVLLRPPDAGLRRHLDRVALCPGVGLALQEEVGPVGIHVGKGDATARARRGRSAALTRPPEQGPGEGSDAR